MIEMNAEGTRDVVSKFEKWPVHYIKKNVDGGHLNVPDFQRNDVWKNPDKSRLIESILRGIPIPMIYLAKEEGKKYAVIDGQQRIKSIVQYLDDKFGLSGLQVLTYLKNQRYSNLKGKHKPLASRLLDAEIPVIIITARADDEIVYEIFDRINTSGMKLNPQEIRNCMYHGGYNDLVKKELALEDNFEYLLGSSQDKFHRRMLDAELVLRFFAFHRLERINVYKPPLKRFLDREMEEHRNISDVEKQGFTNIFKESVKLTKEVFDKKAFRKFNRVSENEVNGGWENQIIRGIFDVVMCGFALYVEGIDWGDRETIVQFKDAIREELIYLMVHDDKFIDATSGSRTDKENPVRTRFKIWFDSLREITENQNNTFSLERKKQVYDSNPECCICNKTIQNLDDAEINNVDYWRGEEIPRNARVAHRYCNRKAYSDFRQSETEKSKNKQENKLLNPCKSAS
jgi:uncharacterized protein with ParB-like and HNH nuclease domain